MSQENVISARQNLDAFDRRDRAAFLAARDPACEVVPDERWPEPGVITGREAAWDFYVSVAEALGMDSTDAEIIDAGGEKVVGHRAAEARGQASGATVVFGYSVVTTFREGKIVREEWFADRTEALKAAGLAE
jgi:ketosteroid isomerase-like protein